MKDRTGERIVLPYPDKLVVVHLENLSECIVLVGFPVAALSGALLRRCTVAALHVRSSAFFERLEDCIVCVSAAQIRVRDGLRSTLLARASCAPALEACADLRLAPHSAWMEHLPLQLQDELTTEAEAGRREWLSAEDLSWARAHASPNWLTCTTAPTCPFK